MKIQKTTPVERLKNDLMLTQLTYMFYAASVDGFDKLLSEEGNFLNLSKMRFLANLNGYFNGLQNGQIFGVCVLHGICLDSLPGCEMLEIRYATEYGLIDDNGVYMFPPNSELREGEKRLRLVFRMEDSKIVEIKETRKFISKIKFNQKEIIYN